MILVIFQLSNKKNFYLYSFSGIISSFNGAYGNLKNLFLS